MAPRAGRAWFPVVGSLGSVGGLVRVDVMPGTCRDDRFAPALAAGVTLAGGAGSVNVELWPAGLELDGQSFELALALAAWSYTTDVELPSRLAFSGHVSGIDLSAPAGLAEKRRVVDDAWGPEARLLSGPTGALRVDYASTLPEMVRDHLSALVPSTPLHRLVKHANDHYDAHRWAQAADFAARALAEGRDVLGPEVAFKLATRQAHALAHLGDPRAAPLLAEVLASGLATGPGDQAEACAVFAIATLDAGQPERALALLADGLERAPTATARMKLLGSQARCLSALGRHDAARQSAKEALDCAAPGDRARSLVDRARWHLRAGDVTACHADLAAAREALVQARRVEPRGADLTAAFLQLLDAQVHFARDQRDEARTLVAPLTHHVDLAIRLGAAELIARLGGDPDPALASLDDALPPGIVTRLRARVELARAHPDLRRVERWLGHPVPDAAACAAELAVALPY